MSQAIKKSGSPKSTSKKIKTVDSNFVPNKSQISKKSIELSNKRMTPPSTSPPSITVKRNVSMEKELHHKIQRSPLANLSRKSKHRPPRSILTTVRKQPADKRLNLKRRLLTFAIYIIILVLVVVIGATIFVGLHKMQSLNRNWTCRQLKDRSWREWKENCTNPNTKMKECDAAKKKMFDGVAKCYGHPAQPTIPTSNFSRALIYAYSIYSMIGYGNVAALTTTNRVATIFYAFFGIPLFMAYLNHMGKWFHYGLIYTYERVRRRCGGGEKFILTTTNAEDNAIFIFSLIVLIVYLLAAAGLYAMLQNWGYWQSLYFVFQSIALIGFGDVFTGLENASFVMTHITVCTLGIVLLAMCFFVLKDLCAKVVQRLVDYFAKKFNLIPPKTTASQKSGGDAKTAVAPAPGDDDTIEEVQDVSFTFDSGIKPEKDDKKESISKERTSKKSRKSKKGEGKKTK